MDLLETRRSVEGTLARWIAVDSESFLGVFTGPYAAWPRSVLRDYPVVAAADEYLDIAELLTPGAALDASARSADLTLPLREAASGFYSFSAEGHGGSVYLLEAKPARPMLLHDAPEVLVRAARLVVFANTSFASISQLDIAEHTSVLA